ncbi:hypothetical protein IV203_031913 [Nitzschia inconspicua]|uniref:Uncharacterized protein n=1 Tax=Nitzschia inconspicua TaxID=303405 RepID=A0A9K3LV94_9STRA|nr:hypothetical protein IV203_031913 [Nitzschia inconspicua]
MKPPVSPPVINNLKAATANFTTEKAFPHNATVPERQDRLVLLPIHCFKESNAAIVLRGGSPLIAGIPTRIHSETYLKRWKTF